MTQATFAEKQTRSVRAGVFSTVTATEEAVSRLLAAGFTPPQITVICSDETKERHFREFEHQEQAGSNTPAAVATGGAIGATLGGLATGALRGDLRRRLFLLLRVRRKTGLHLQSELRPMQV